MFAAALDDIKLRCPALEAERALRTPTSTPFPDLEAQRASPTPTPRPDPEARESAVASNEVALNEIPQKEATPTPSCATADGSAHSTTEAIQKNPSTMHEDTSPMQDTLPEGLTTLARRGYSGTSQPSGQQSLEQNDSTDAGASLPPAYSVDLDDMPADLFGNFWVSLSSRAS